MRGLDPRIHPKIHRKTMDCRVKPGNDVEMDYLPQQAQVLLWSCAGLTRATIKILRYSTGTGRLGFVHFGCAE
jgi:hypothetical protein